MTDRREIQEKTAKRFWSKVEKDPTGDTGCWNWITSLNRDGYGQFRLPKKQVFAHRFAYEMLVGPIPRGRVLDHLCRNRKCVNPDHLEPVTNRVNLLRGETFVARNAATTHCPKGHPYSGDNLYVAPSGRRGCRACRRVAAKKYEMNKRRVAHV